MAPSRKTHHKHASAEGATDTRRAHETHFFHDVMRSVAGSDGILMLGPSTAKLELYRYIRKHDHGLESKVVGIETVDQPTDRQLMAYVRKYFSDPSVADAPIAVSVN